MGLKSCKISLLHVSIFFGALLIQACLGSHVTETKLPGATEVLDLGGEAMRNRGAGYLLCDYICWKCQEATPRKSLFCNDHCVTGL